MVRKLSKFLKINQKLFFLSVNLIHPHAPSQNKKPVANQNRFATGRAYKVSLLSHQALRLCLSTDLLNLITYIIMHPIKNVKRFFEKTDSVRLENQIVALRHVEKGMKNRHLNSIFMIGPIFCASMPTTGVS
jgi:hypothetical protein